MFTKPEADPNTVASIILGGGAGTRLFPLTGRRAKPAAKLSASGDEAWKDWEADVLALGAIAKGCISVLYPHLSENLEFIKNNGADRCILITLLDGKFPLIPRRFLNSANTLFRLVGACVFIIYLALLYGTYVPDW